MASSGYTFVPENERLPGHAVKKLGDANDRHVPIEFQFRLQLGQGVIRPIALVPAGVRLLGDFQILVFWNAALSDDEADAAGRAIGDFQP